MSTQIAVRLPDDLVAYVDDAVRAGGGSRASVVTAALTELRRRQVAERDAAILAREGDYADFEHLAGNASMDDLA